MDSRLKMLKLQLQDVLNKNNVKVVSVKFKTDDSYYPIVDHYFEINEEIFFDQDVYDFVYNLIEDNIK